MQDAVVAVVGEFGRRVDTAPTRDRFLRAVSASQGHRHRSARLKRLQITDINPLFSGQPQRFAGDALRELQRQNAHSDQVGTVDTLEGLGDHYPNPQQARPLRRPVTAGT